MKHIFLALLVLILGSNLCLAQQAQAPTTTKVITGKVESVTLADPGKGTKSEIVLVDDSGNKTTVLVKSTTTIYNTDLKATTLENIKKDNKVKVKYLTTKEGVNEATSINLLNQ